MKSCPCRPSSARRRTPSPCGLLVSRTGRWHRSTRMTSLKERPFLVDYPSVPIYLFFERDGIFSGPSFFSQPRSCDTSFFVRVDEANPLYNASATSPFEWAAKGSTVDLPSFPFSFPECERPTSVSSPHIFCPLKIRLPPCPVYTAIFPIRGRTWYSLRFQLSRTPLLY